jgi:hypothetical protein
VKKFEDDPMAKKVLTDAAKNQGVERIDIVSFDRGDIVKGTKLTSPGYWNSTSNKIYIRSDLTEGEAIATLLYEGLRAKHEKEMRPFYADCKAGKVSRDDYAKRIEQISYEYMKEHHDIAKTSVGKMDWPAAADKFDKPLDTVWKTFEAYAKDQDTVKPGQEVSHTEQIRQNWDRLYKKAWDDAHK